jgi:hypothetical protein
MDDIKKESTLLQQDEKRLGGKAMRDNKGKMRLELVPSSLLYGVAKVGEFGARKYDDDNWRKGYNWSVPYSSAMRHLTSWWDGEDSDDESGLNHLYHAAFNLAILIEFLETHKDKDNRPAKKYRICTKKDL